MGIAIGGTSNAGEGMIVGVIDTGIAMDNPSFAPLEDATMPAGIPCEFEEEPQFECNTKVIGAQYFRASGNIIDSEVFPHRHEWARLTHSGHVGRQQWCPHVSQRGRLGRRLGHGTTGTDHCLQGALEHRRRPGHRNF
ncbi:hypothetical protein L0A91_14395 [Ornithinimicrobium sp. INDO-MA30-4]|nr:hypothetical protein [Ornithinimicrobium sp. INDO-MA30-4]UJH70311.1 hypothetical protein L0A91_14395 [Ornithinimicrobium sp. INDO-MA30-4]